MAGHEGVPVLLLSAGARIKLLSADDAGAEPGLTYITGDPDGR